MVQIEDELAAHGYKVIRLLGAGNFSRVYLVGEQKGRIYACKISQETEMLRREWETLSSLRHPAIPQGVMFWEAQFAYLVMEYVTGSSVQELLARRGRLSERCTVQVAMELADCLRYLHAEGILYRDLKPDNIMLRQDGRVALADYGCVCRIGVKPDAKAGTLGFAAPEQLGAKVHLTASCDVYGLGKSLETMLGNGRSSSRLRKVVRACVREEAENRVPDMYSLMELLDWAAQKGERRKKEIRSKRMRTRKAVGGYYERGKCSLGQFGKALLQGKLRIYKNVFPFRRNGDMIK